MPNNTRGLDIEVVTPKTRTRGKNYLFCIGIDKYQHWDVLHSAVKDAKEICRILTRYYQFEESHVLSLYDDQATRKAVFSKLGELKDTLTENDNLVIYYSGHGYYDKEVKTTYWIPVDAEKEKSQAIDWINTDTVINHLIPIKSFHIFLMIDSCFSGTLFKYRAAAPKGEDFRSRTALASGREEVVMDSLDGGHSPFAQGIIDMLESAAVQYLRTSQLADAVKEFLGSLEIKQTPKFGRLMPEYDEYGDFIFHLKITESEAWANAVEGGTFESYQAFIESFPESKHNPEAAEAYSWLRAKESNSIVSLQSHLNKYHQGKYFVVANSLLSQLEEEELWKKTVANDTLSAYFNYLHKFPTGKYKQEAQQKTRKMNEDDEDRAWEQALNTNTVQGYRNYLRRDGSKKYEAQAEERLTSLTADTKDVYLDEETIWSRAKKQNTYLAILDFTDRFPDSNNLPEAQNKMRHLDDLAFNKIKMAESSARLSIQEKIAKCLQYFDKYPGAPNNSFVKKIKDRLQIEEIKSIHKKRS